MTKPMIALSLGWGVQSWTLAAMSALGVLPRLDLAVHADTTHERQATYEFAATWTPWLAEHGIQVETAINDIGRLTAVVAAKNEVQIPAFTINDGKKGQIRRQCTGAWKIAPIKRVLQQHRAGRPVELWLGITTDEYQRAKDADVKYITHAFPLLEMGFSRKDCLDWLEAHGLPSPGKSSCVFCPYMNKSAWEDMRARSGADWEHAVEIDLAIRNVRPPGELFVHGKRIPLEQAVPATTAERMIRERDLELLASDDDDAECDSAHCFL